MSSFFESVQNLNAVKEERAHPRVAVPTEQQAAESFQLYEEILAGSRIDQAEIAGIAIDVGSSAAEVILATEMMTREDLVGVLAGIWVDGVVQAVNYFKLSVEAQRVPTPEELAEQRQKQFDAQVKALIDHYPELDEPEWAERVARKVYEKDPSRAGDIEFILDVYLEEKAGEGE